MKAIVHLISTGKLGISDYTVKRCSVYFECTLFVILMVINLYSDSDSDFDSESSLV